MINSISIKNFESHKDTHIELHSGCNVLVGESDNGKSSIIRAIKWNAHNRPQGDSYRSDSLSDSKKDKLKLTEVNIKYDKKNILRARDGASGGVNHYEINDGEPLRALKSDVPDEVQEITRIKDVNIQTQHPSDQYFLIGDKPGQIAKEFNKVAGLVVMDKAIQNINSQVRSCNTLIKVSKLEIDTRLEEIENTEWVDFAKKMASKLEDIEFKIMNKQEICDELDSVIYEINKVDLEIAEYLMVDEAVKEINELKTKQKQLAIKSSEYKKLNNVLDELNKVDNKLTHYDYLVQVNLEIKKLKKYNQTIFDKKSAYNTLFNLIITLNDVNTQLNATTDITEAATALKQLDFKQTEITKYKDEIEKIEAVLEKFSTNKKDLEWVIKTLNEEEITYKEIWINQACPVCGRKG